MHRRILAPHCATRRGNSGIFAAFLFATLASAVPSGAQQVGLAMRQAPSPAYYSILYDDFAEGEYVHAGKDFERETRGGIKTASSLWIDSICSETMAGECYYHMGRLPEALAHYNQALGLFNGFSDWMIRVQFPPSIQRANVGQIFNCPWGQSTRNAVIGNYPDKMHIGQGQILTKDAIQRGGAIQAPMLYPVGVQEVVRCTTLAIRRRAELLGPASPQDRLTNDVFAALSRRPGPGNHWGDVWIGVQLGCVAAAAGNEPVARNELEQSIVAAGEFDHPLTCVALLELGKLDLKGGDFASASQRFLEASISAGQYGDFGVVEEALRHGLAVHLITNQQNVYPPLAPAAAWANREGYLQLQASMLTLLAENLTALGQPDKALDAVAQARRAVGRRSMGAGRMGARVSFANAQALYGQGKSDQAAGMLGNALDYQLGARRNGGSIWLFQLGMTDNLYSKGEMQPRVAMDLYTQLLRDPQPADWATEPMEAISVLVDQHPDIYENWFAAALERREPEKAFEIADRIRRHRFLSTLEMGGRLTALRWLLEGPAELLDPQATLERQQLLNAFPAYAELSQQAAAMRAQLRQAPAKSDDPDEQRAQAKLLADWAKICLTQEQMLREMALRRKPASIVFPPVRSLQEIQEALPPGTAMLSFLMTQRHGAHAFLTTNEKGKYELWDIPDSAPFQRKLVTFLRELGNYDPNGQVDVKALAEESWKAPAAEILELLTKGSKTKLPGDFTELAIVPDGPLWYVPFEALADGAGADAEPLLARMKVRYAPLASLAVPDRRPRGASGKTAVISGRLYSREDQAQTLATAEDIAKALPGAVVYDAQPPSPTVVARTMFDRLLVLADIPAIDRDAYAWSPMGNEKGSLGGSLGVWFGLPWGSPDQVLLPGFHSAAERALQKPNGKPGDEIFFSLCGLMASGTRTVLLSRWRTGGQTCYELMREFTQELPHSSAAAAWQRSVMLGRDFAVTSDTEPRVKKNTSEQALTAQHPFFWSGYLLVDPGIEPPPEQEPALQQAARP